MELYPQGREHAPTSLKSLRKSARARQFDVSPKSTRRLIFDTQEESCDYERCSPLNVPAHPLYGFSGDRQAVEKHEEFTRSLSIPPNYGKHQHLTEECGSITTTANPPHCSTISPEPGVKSPSSFAFSTDMVSPLRTKEEPPHGFPRLSISPLI